MHYKTIRLLRVEKGWTQAELAKKSGVSIVTVCLIETGKTKPSVDTILKISRAFSIDPSILSTADVRLIIGEND